MDWPRNGKNWHPPVWTSSSRRGLGDRRSLQCRSSQNGRDISLLIYTYNAVSTFMSVPWDQPVGSIPDPIVDEEAGLHWHWYYDPNAGGMAVPFRKYRGTPIHALDMAYLLWCRRECTKVLPVLVFASPTLHFMNRQCLLRRHLTTTMLGFGSTSTPRLNTTIWISWFHSGNVTEVCIMYVCTWKMANHSPGKRLGDCRDQPYFVFCRKKKKLTQKVSLFLSKEAGI
jgi:hypothetical protein